MTLDDFWRANYWRMVGYCCTVWHNEADVEEEVADVIHRHFDEYKIKIENEGHAKFETMRRWMNRRVLLNLNAKTGKYRRGDYEQTGHEDDATVNHETLHWDTPENILCLQQRLPPVPEILIEYEQYTGGRGAGGNTSTYKSKFCRERKKFMEALHANR